MLSIYQQHDIEEINTENRMKKYIERGFNVKLHPQFDEIDTFIKTTLLSKKYADIDNYIDSVK